MIYRHWYGPLLGQTVSHVWFSYAWCLFFEFGQLAEGAWYTNLRGEPKQYEPSGEWSLTSMQSWPEWTLRIGKRVVATSEDREVVRRAALHRLISRRLQALEISEATRATRLTFSLGLVLETTTTIPSLRHVPRWLLHERAEEEESWDCVMLGLPKDWVTRPD